MRSPTGEVEGRLLAIGDIHGQARHLEVLLEAVDVAEHDRLILLGDYVDGGPHAARVLDIVQDLLTRPQTVALRGNHDEVLVNALGPLDTLIAAHAVALDVVLVTGNEREFRRVAGLRVEGWLRS